MNNSGLSSNVLVAFAIGIAWMAIGAIIVFRSEKRLSGMGIKELCKGNSAEKSYFFQGSNSVMFWSFIWPLAIMAARGYERHRRAGR